MAPAPDAPPAAPSVLADSQKLTASPSANAYAHYLKAKQYQAMGEDALARRNLTLALGFDEGSAFLHAELGALYLASRSLDAAEESLARAAALDPKWERPLYLLGEVAFQRNLYDQAESRFAAALALKPDAPEILRRLVETLYLKHGAASAIAWLEPYAKTHPTLVHAEALLAKLYRETQDYPKLEAALSRLLALDSEDTTAIDQLSAWYDRTGRYAQAIELFARLIDILPPHPFLYVRLGDFQLKAKHPEEAARAFANARAFDPSDDRIGQLVGLAYLDAGKWREASGVFLDLIERGGDPGLRYYLGQSYMRAGHYARAIAAFGEVSHSDPDFFTGAMADAARCHMALGQNAKAEAAIRELISESATHPDAYTLAAQFYRDIRQPRRALKLLEEALAARPNDVNLLFARGVFQEEQGEEAQALADMRRVLELDPDHADALNFVGYLFAERKENLEEAERLVRHAMLRKPEEGYILDSLGYILYQRGENAEALKWLRLAAMIEPDEPDILLHLALAIERAAEAPENLNAVLRRAAALPLTPEQSRQFKAAFGTRWERLRAASAPKGKRP